MLAFRPAHVPMARDRTSGFRFVSSARHMVHAVDADTGLRTTGAVRFVQRRPEMISSVRVTAGNSSTLMRLAPIAVDPPTHTKYRKILDPMFSPHNAMEDDDEGNSNTSADNR